jgi:hypothetical protein
MKRGITGMLTIVKASLVGSALMLLAGCTGYLTNYQTPCVQGHVCECVQYTTVNRSWVDCRDYGRVKSRAYYLPPLTPFDPAGKNAVSVRLKRERRVGET